MINLAQYVGPHVLSPDWTPECIGNASRLLEACSRLEMAMALDGVVFPVNPATGSGVSGQTFGGFRPQDCSQGAPDSAHKTGEAVDRYDPHGEIDVWLMAHQELLEKFGIYIEHPSATNGWSHWSTRAPRSGRHVFYP